MYSTVFLCVKEKNKYVFTCKEFQDFLEADQYFKTKYMVINNNLTAVGYNPIAVNNNPIAVNNNPLAVNNNPLAVNNNPIAVNNNPLAVNNNPIAVNNNPLATPTVISYSPAVIPICKFMPQVIRRQILQFKLASIYNRVSIS